MFITTKFFESIDDHINLIMTTKEFEHNMTKFHFNPISLTSKTLNFFPNVETFHLYCYNDTYLEGGRIQQYCSWKTTPYHETKGKQINGKPIEFKNIIWSPQDTIDAFNGTPIANVIIPDGIKEIDSTSFLNVYYLMELTIPSTVKTIPKNCLRNVQPLTNITLSLNDSQVVIGNKIFNTPHLETAFYLPDGIKIINGKKVDRDFTSFEIPTTVTSIDKDRASCFL